jgi:dimethylhistidine N-methyltransferase
VDPAFRADVLAGLAEPIPAIPARWFYDRRGSELFDEITRLPAYYPTRIETALLEAPQAYVPVDISGDSLRESAAVVDRDFHGMAVHPVEADFTTDFGLPEAIDGMERLGFFPGSTIGNFVPQSATDLLRHFRTILGTGARLLIGMDRVKGVERLLAAYDDPEGVTAEFNLNLLRRINRELEADVPIDAFRHQARWNDMLGRIEMHLVATRDVEFGIEGQRFAFAKGQSIHTENSHKYGPRGARLLLLAGGWTPIAEWTDEDEDFALILAEAQRERFAP